MNTIANSKIIRKIPLVIILLTLLANSLTVAQTPDRAANYLTTVHNFADSLLRHATDRFGPRPTAMWASIVDTRTGRVAQYGIPAVADTRASDRALGGSNLYHDVAMLRAFRVLSSTLLKQV